MHDCHVYVVAAPPCGHLVKRGGEDAGSLHDVRFWHSERSSFVNSRVVSGHADGCRSCRSQGNVRISAEHNAYAVKSAAFYRFHAPNLTSGEVSTTRRISC